MIPIRLRCAVCNHPVHGVETIIDQGHRTTTVVAYCHGQTDRMVLRDSDKARWSLAEVEQWEAIGRGEIEGVAFAARSLAP